MISADTDQFAYDSSQSYLTSFPWVSFRLQIYQDPELCPSLPESKWLLSSNWAEILSYGSWSEITQKIIGRSSKSKLSSYWFLVTYKGQLPLSVCSLSDDFQMMFWVISGQQQSISAQFHLVLAPFSMIFRWSSMWFLINYKLISAHSQMIFRWYSDSFSAQCSLFTQCLW